MLNHPGHVTLISWTFLKFLLVVGIIENENLKILPFNSMRFRVYDIFKKWQIDEIGGAAKYYIFLDNVCLK